MGGGKTLIISTLFFTTKKDNGKQCNKLRDYITWKEVHWNQEKIRITQTLSIIRSFPPSDSLSETRFFYAFPKENRLYFEEFDKKKNGTHILVHPIIVSYY